MSLLIAGFGSGCGKTSCAIGLIAALKARNIPVRAAKSGPDFIDAGWLAAASGKPALNLDAWMLPDKFRLREMARNFAGDAFLVLEGAMGLFDGAENGAGSCAQLAKQLGLPILLLLDCRGKSQTIAALCQGMLTYEKLNFAGVTCTHTGSEKHERMLATALAPALQKAGVPLIGFLPRNGAPDIKSRHLGLTQACEQKPDFKQAGEWFSQNCDLDLLLSRCRKNESAPSPARAARPDKTLAKSRVRIAIASDDAFRFCYADLPDLLESLGAEISFFSPLADQKAPACDGIYLPGGYPELYMRELSENTSMLRSIRELADAGIPVYGECGGYIYMMSALIDSDDREWPLLGLLPGNCEVNKRFASLGYRTALAHWPCEAALRGHEFHYASVCDAPAGKPLWNVLDSAGKYLGAQGSRKGTVAGSWVHLYPEASRPFWKAWLDLCRGNHA